MGNQLGTSSKMKANLPKNLNPILNQGCDNTFIPKFGKVPPPTTLPITNLLTLLERKGAL